MQNFREELNRIWEDSNHDSHSFFENIVKLHEVLIRANEVDRANILKGINQITLERQNKIPFLFRTTDSIRVVQKFGMRERRSDLNMRGIQKEHNGNNISVFITGSDEQEVELLERHINSINLDS